MHDGKGLCIQFKDYDTPFILNLRGEKFYFFADKRSTKNNLRFHIKCDSTIDIATPYSLYKQREMLFNIEKIVNESDDCKLKNDIINYFKSCKK